MSISFPKGRLVFDITNKTASRLIKETSPSKIMKLAHKKYKEIVLDITSFDKGDKFVTDILSVAMLLVTEHNYSLEEVRKYLSSLMNNSLTRLACKKYTTKEREKLKQSASRSKYNKKPYSWKFELKDGDNINRCSATFHGYGICYSMNKLGPSYRHM